MCVCVCGGGGVVGGGGGGGGGGDTIIDTTFGGILGDLYGKSCWMVSLP